jgi:hypothetical protein
MAVEPDVAYDRSVNPNRSAAGFDLTPPTLDQQTNLEADLSPEESDVLFRHGTEAAFCGGLLDEHRDGVFTCRLCGLPLFLAGHKFESGTGWPSFTAPFDEEHLETLRIPATAWSAQSFSAHAVAAIKGTSSRTARRPLDSATASTRSPSSSRRATSRCPISWDVARLRENRGCYQGPMDDSNCSQHLSHAVEVGRSGVHRMLRVFCTAYIA